MGDADDEDNIDDDADDSDLDDFPADSSGLRAGDIDRRFQRLEDRSNQMDAKLDRLVQFVETAMRNNRAPHLDPRGGTPNLNPPTAVDLTRRDVVTRHRSRDTLALQKAIRKHWTKLMDKWTPPAEGMVASYRLEQGPACTAAAFSPDAKARTKSDWNISAVEVFAESFLGSDNANVIPEQPGDDFRDTVREAATARLRSWRKIHHLASRSPDERARIRKQNRHAERKRTMFLRRLNAALAHEECQPHAAIIQALGPAGMSSDESDHVDASGVPQYRIKKLQWRHPDLVPFLRILDGVHRFNRFQDSSEDRTAGAGAQPHIRNLMNGETLESTSKPPIGLLRCLYHPELLRTPEGARLRAKPSEDYDFAHQAAIVE